MPSNCLPFALCPVLSLLTCALAGGREFHVSPTGNDGNDGSPARPFATVSHAQRAVRALPRPLAEPVTVFLRGGVHRLEEILSFGPEDSGAVGAPVVYRSYPGERAVLSGGRVLGGTWHPTPGKPYWQLEMPAGERFFSLYADHLSRPRARYPNWDQKVLRAEGRAAGEHPRRTFRYFPGDIESAWSHTTDIDIVLLCSWTPTIHRIERIDAENRIVHFSESQAWWELDQWERNFRYYVSNVLEALDDPGEWYLDYRNGLLYYYPMPGEDPNAVEFVVPVMTSRLLEIEGDLAAGKLVEYLHFQDLEFRHLDGDMDRYDGMYRQGHMYLTAAVVAKGLRDASFQGCTFAQLGEYALELADGCRDVRVQRCHFHDLGAGAMQLGVTDLRTLLSPRLVIRPDDIRLEAEDAELVPPMERRQDPGASGGSYVVLPDGQSDGAVRFVVELAAPGAYEMIAQVLAPDGQSDSFTVKINDGPVHTYDTGSGREWFASRVRSRELGSEPFLARLQAGGNVIAFGGREPGTQLAQLVLRRVEDDGGEGEGEGEGEGDASANEVLDLLIDNNCIHRLGTIWHGCYGIVNRFASRSRITHNEIFDIHWDAVALDARWNWQGEKHAYGNVVAYNHFHHLGLRYHTDAAGVYQFGPLDTHIHHNLIHDTVAYPYICGYAGIYLDEQSRNAVVENNLVYNLEWYAYFQHWGEDNVFRNNIGAFARDGFVRRGGLHRLRSNHFEVYRNIYVARDDIALRGSWAEGERPALLRQNMYDTIAPDTELTFAGMSFDEWRDSGQDEGSIVGDPGFRDPANFDFTLSPDSAAVRELGFVPFDEEIRKAGLYGDPQWVSISSRFSRRQPVPTWTPDDLARLISFDLDFEEWPVGHQVSQFRLSTSAERTFAVTDEAAFTGSQSYKCTDRKGLAKPFYPYIHMAPRRMDKGQVTLAFAAMLHAETPAPFYVEFRGAGSTDQVGPSIHFDNDGRVVANGQEMLVAPAGAWTHAKISFKLAEDAPKTYDLVLSYDGDSIRATLPFRHETFSAVRWIGFVAKEDIDGIFYLDDMRLTYD